MTQQGQLQADEPGEMTRQEIIDEVAFTLVDEVAEYFDTYHGKARTPVAGHDSELGRGEYGQIRRQALGQGSVRHRRRIIKQRPLPRGSGLIVFVSWREQVARSKLLWKAERSPTNLSRKLRCSPHI